MLHRRRCSAPRCSASTQNASPEAGAACLEPAASSLAADVSAAVASHIAYQCQQPRRRCPQTRMGAAQRAALARRGVGGKCPVRGALCPSLMPRPHVGNGPNSAATPDAAAQRRAARVAWRCSTVAGFGGAFAACSVTSCAALQPQRAPRRASRRASRRRACIAAAWRSRFADVARVVRRRLRKTRRNPCRAARAAASPPPARAATPDAPARHADLAGRALASHRAADPRRGRTAARCSASLSARVRCFRRHAARRRRRRRDARPGVVRQRERRGAGLGFSL